MGKSHPEKVFVVTNIISSDGTVKTFSDPPSDVPPQIPPRMKKRGPALPEKPPHMRMTPTISTSQIMREPLKPKVLSTLNIDTRPKGGREVLVAATKSTREKPVEKRQREPAKLLLPTSSGGPGARKELSALSSSKPDTQKADFSGKFHMGRKSGSSTQPLLLIPRNMLGWGTAPVSYALWMQRDVVAPSKGGAARREPLVKQQPALKPPSCSRSGSVTRSGSLTSQDSSSSDSGNETFPKSVLKKQKRATPCTASKGSTNSKKLEHKKNVTFNAFATVQLMEE